MPSTTLLEMPPEEQAQMRAVLRRTRYGYLSGLPCHTAVYCGPQPHGDWVLENNGTENPVKA
jgi:hypothetical protein